MDELKLLREEWDEPGAQGEDAWSAARTALLDRAAASRQRPSGRRIRLSRTGVRIAAVGVFAIVLAAVVTVVQTGGGGGRPVVPGIPTAPPASAAQVLDRAATAAEHRPFQAPRPDQWIYRRYQNVPVKQRWYLEGPGRPSVSIIEEQWTRADGKRSAFLANGRLRTVDLSDPRSRPIWPPQDYAGLAALPTNPDKLLALIQRRTGPPPPRQIPSLPAGCAIRGDLDRESSILGQLLLTGLLPPKLEAAIYRAMKRLPGIMVTRTTGPNGRPEIALGRFENGWQHNEVLFDARDYRFVGMRSIAVKDPNALMRQCRMLSSGGLNMRVINNGVVDKAGQRP
jgi:hypothetical protein